MAAKRKRLNGDNSQTDKENTPKSRRAQLEVQDHYTDIDLHASPNSPQKSYKPKRGRPPGSATKAKTTLNGTGQQTDSPTLKKRGKLLFTTPTKARATQENIQDNHVTPITNADRSARRKSTRALVQRAINNDLSEGDELADVDSLARTIREGGEVIGSDEESEEDVEDELARDLGPPTPSRPGPKQYRKARRKRTPTPPGDLPPHELYFFHNRPGNAKISNNSLAPLSLLSHEQYHSQITAYKDPHASSIAFLHTLHSRSFPQWAFELSQSFSICLYGYGSKRHLVQSFAEHLYSLPCPVEPPRIVIINGFHPTLTIRQILSTVATQVLDSTPSTIPPKLGSQPHETLDSILDRLATSSPISPIYLFINSLDASSLRRPPIPSLLAQLASSPHIRLLASCDTPTFPLLWDTTLREQYNFLFHDTTTFRSYAEAEIHSVVDDVNELFGRSGRSIIGKEGVSFVLRSLPENARNVYRILIAELLAGMENDEEPQQHGPNKDAGLAGSKSKFFQEHNGIEHQVLYQKAVEEFICSSEMAFRTLLKEFHDHEMVVTRRDAAGMELLGVPFRKEEMEAILQDLME